METKHLHGEGKKILLVEPDQKLAKKFYFLFRKEGFVPISTDRAAEAIRKIQLKMR